MSRSQILGISAMAVALLLALILGLWAGQRLDQIDQAAHSADLPPLPDWAHAPLPDFSTYQDVNEKKDAFFNFLFPRIALANQRVLMLREHLNVLEDKETLTEEDKKWLQSQADRLRVDEPVGSEAMFSQLKRRLDIVPPSLVLAQAANESAWGTSRFARQGNNLFGQWCFSPGCGIVPSRRGEDQTHEVASFSSPYQSVRGYITNLNRHNSYQLLRDERAEARQNDSFPSGVALAQGLKSYSERGEDYIQEIVHMMRYNSLGFYDELFRDLDRRQDKLAPQALADQLEKRRG